MPEIRYHDFDAQLKRLKTFPVFLLFGEELLYKTALDRLKSVLVPEAARDFSYEPIEGDDVYDALERVNTYSLSGGEKIVGLLDSKIFLTVKDTAEIIEKARLAHNARELKKAAGFLLKVLGLKELSLEQAAGERSAWYDRDKFGDEAWVNEILAYCRQHDLRVPKAKDPLKDLHRAVEKGFPEGHYLVITAETINRQRKLYKAIAERGLVVDCSVASGARWADQQDQESMLRDQMMKILGRSKKRPEPKLFEAVYDLTGFDLRTFITNVEKLIQYVGTREVITVADVNAALTRTRLDPIYILTEAIGERSLQKSLITMNSLFSNQIPPLQILGAITNQVRRILTACCFLADHQGRSFKPGMTYQQFQHTAMRDVVAYDQRNAQSASVPTADSAAEKPSKAKALNLPDELILARSPKNAYPVFMLLGKATRYQAEELLNALESLARADMALKTSAHDPKMILERVIFSICGKFDQPPTQE